MKRISMLAALGGALTLCGSAFAAPVPDEKIQDVIEMYQTQFEAGRAARTLTLEIVVEMANKAVGMLDVNELTVDQMMELGDNGVLTYVRGEAADSVVDRLETFAGAETVEGAKAQIAIAGLTASMSQDGDEIVGKVGEALRHPKIIEAMETDAAVQLFGMMSLLERFDVSSISDEVLMLAKAVDGDFNPEAAPMVMSFNSVVNSVADDSQKKMIRKNLIAWAEGAKDKIEDPRMVGSLERSLTLMNSAFGRGELIGYTAPELTFAWSSDNKAQKLSDYNGKVVVVDFWATWCGPCIASFPDVAKLQKFYQGYPVEVIGVTSLQGSHYGADGKVDTTDNPDKEYSLMPGFMDEKNMTWTVAFSEQEVFNPEYGVTGIPHVAIVDTEGKTRFNKIHPSSQVTPFSEKVAMINGLLKEAGLEYPVYEDE